MLVHVALSPPALFLLVAASSMPPLSDSSFSKDASNQIRGPQECCFTDASFLEVVFTGARGQGCSPWILGLLQFCSG